MRLQHFHEFFAIKIKLSQTKDNCCGKFYVWNIFTSEFLLVRWQRTNQPKYNPRFPNVFSHFHRSWCKCALKGLQRHIPARCTFPVKSKQSQHSDSYWLFKAKLTVFSPDEITVAKSIQNSILKLSLAWKLHVSATSVFRYSMQRM